MPTQNRSVCGKKITEWLKNESAANHSAMGWTERTKRVLKPGDSPRKAQG